MVYTYTQTNTHIDTPRQSVKDRSKKDKSIKDKFFFLAKYRNLAKKAFT